MACSSKAVLYRYHYDPLDRLAGATSLGQPDTLRFYQKNRLATQIQGAVQRTIVQHEELFLAQQQRSDSAIETTLLATDQQRSVLHLLDNTDTYSLAYNPYGHHPADSGITSLLGFNGEHRDPATGHYLLGNGYRAFNSVLMRFNSPDSLSPFGEGGINVYAYCEGDPVNLVDPSGHIPFLNPARISSPFIPNYRARGISPPPWLRASARSKSPALNSTQNELVRAPASTRSNTLQQVKPPARSDVKQSLMDLTSESEAASLLKLRQKFYNYPKRNKTVRKFDSSVPADATERALKTSSFEGGENYFRRHLEILESSPSDYLHRKRSIGFLKASLERHSGVFSEYRKNLAIRDGV